MKPAQASRRPDIVHPRRQRRREWPHVSRRDARHATPMCRALSSIRTSFFLPEIHTGVSRLVITWLVCGWDLTDRIAVLRVSSNVVTCTPSRKSCEILSRSRRLRRRMFFVHERFTRNYVSFYEASECLASTGREAPTDADLKPESRRCRLVF